MSCSHSHLSNSVKSTKPKSAHALPSCAAQVVKSFARISLADDSEETEGLGVGMEAATTQV